MYLYIYMYLYTPNVFIFTDMCIFFMYEYV